MTNTNLKPTVIQERPFPVGGQKSSDSSGGANSPNQIPDKSFPSPVVANNMVGASLNTISRRVLSNFTFGQYGAIVVGKYVSGVSGDIKISPNGIVGRNSSGTTTFAIDGTTGNASFLGTIYATAGSIGGFTIQSGYLYAGSGSSVAGLSPADYPFWAGASYGSRASAPFRVTPAGAMTALSGSIGGWDIASTTLSKNSVLLDSGGMILVGTSNDNIALLISSTPVISFMIGGAVKGLLRATTAGNGGIGVIGGDMALDNGYSYLVKGTGSGNYGGLGADSSNNVLLRATSANELFIKSNNDDTSYFHTTNSHVYINARGDGKVYITGGGGLEFNTSSGNKIKYNQNIDMGEHNIDQCDTVWAYHFSTRSEVYDGDPFAVLNTLKISGKGKKGWNKVNHDLVHNDILLINDKKEKGYSLDRLIEIQRLAILELKVEIDKLNKKPKA
jgi:hypothetical protein